MVQNGIKLRKLAMKLTTMKLNTKNILKKVEAVKSLTWLIDMKTPAGSSTLPVRWGRYQKFLLRLYENIRMLYGRFFDKK